MYFKRLEIFGFKSFADKTVLNFEPGITAVIGPNGCGKSNIFDAIRWVLGEQSVKELRGSSMEDVIFNGTDKRPGLGFAEVSLTFANEDRALPVDYNEVTVSRRLFRSGESEYLLNKTPVRLKDVLELFMGTGIGSEAYSLVQQGKVDLVVSAKPEDRRAILDEASGITKYKAKRREALNRLRDTENNLLRINDIIIEVKRQISSLERQANKARRYKGEFEKLKTLEVRFAQHELETLEKEKQSLRQRVEDLQQQEVRASEELRQLQSSLEQESAILEDLEGKIGEISAEDIKLDGQKDVCEKQIGFNEERLQTLALNEKRLAEKSGQLTERCRYQQDKIREVREALENLLVAVDTNQRSLQEKRSHLEQVTQTIQQSKNTIQGEEDKILDINSNQVQVKNRLTEVMKEGQGLLARKRRLEIENTKVIQEKKDVDTRLEGINHKIDEVMLRIEATRTELSKSQELLLEKTARFNALEHSIDQLEKNRLFLRSQKEFIEKMTAQYQDIPDPIIEGRLLTNVQPQSHHTGIIGKVKNVRALSPEEFEQLKSGFSQETKTLFEISCETKFIELDIQQIASRIVDLDREIEAKLNSREQLLAELAQQKKDVAQIELAIQEHEKTYSIHGAQKNDVLVEVKKLSDELDLLKLELEDVTGSLTEMKINEDNLIGQLDSLNQELTLAQLRIKERQDLIAQQSQEREQTTVAVAQLEAEAVSLADKKKGLLDNLAVFEEALKTSQEEIARIEEECRDILRQRELFTLDIARIREKIVLLEEQKQSLRVVLTQYENQKKEIQVKLDSLRVQLTQVAEQLDQVRQALHREEMAGQQFAFQEKEIKDRLMQTYRIDLDQYTPEAVKDQEGSDVAAPKENLDLPFEELPTAIEKLKKRCESFGSVNLVAIEEFESLRERFEFLTKQQSDLLTAKESLHETIRKINRQTRQMFMDTFTKVSEEFRIYYRMLFGGGDAQLVLLDPENVLESGIEIIARPPGKKLQNISLLSGGEKSLTAIALIFGVFKVNPSPFCVLDEIDAALDESNVGRFSFLLKDFAKIAQFIVITHNKKTIAIADVMYGITMQETGMSKIVSVKFAEQDKSKARNSEVPAAV